jgi:hypothetical protein
MAFEITCSKSLVSRSLQSRTASIVCGILLWAPFANVAFAVEAKVILDQILGEAIPQLQNVMASMGQGCSGGSNGVPPVGWGEKQKSGNLAVNAFSAARTALATGQTSDAVQQINTGVSQLDALINGLHNSCSGGASGVDPVSYSNYVRFRDVLKERLETAKRFL